MDNFSVLIGGKAGYGIDRSSTILARLFNQLGYRIYVYRDYPSLIRGGHTFSIIRASKKRIYTHANRVDFILALNQDTYDLHKSKLNSNGIVIYDQGSVKAEGVAIPADRILKEENAPELLRNTCVIGAFCKVAGIGWEMLEKVIGQSVSRDLEINLKVARRGYDEAKGSVKIEKVPQSPLPMLTGNEAVSLGLIKAGLKSYVAYPMTPSSTILHFMAENSEKFSLKVMHPESEIGVIIMALGFSYAGDKVAVGTSGGGFCLMTEGLSFAGMAELPVVIVLGQRPGPSTGLPTYSSQTELHFALNAGQGEFPRFVVAPGDAEESYYWSAVAMNLAWQFQVQSIILTDKNVAEGGFNFDIDSVKEIKETGPVLWDVKNDYRRYLDTKSGVSPIAFPSNKEAIIKINSYEHDEAGITTEDPAITKSMTEKRMRKAMALKNELENYGTVNTYGNKDSATTVLCWGSNKGVCVEASEKLGLRVVHPVVLSPFPLKKFGEALKGVKKLICVENNATGQLLKLIRQYGFNAHVVVLKYDGRPFSLDEMEEELKKAVK